MSLKADLLRGNTETIILRFLSEKDNYGYEINKQIEKKSGGAVILNEATLYTAFRRMEKAGLITSYWGSENSGARRRYYSITEKGRETYKKNLSEWEESKDLLERLMNENEKD